jgi:LPS-assembly lipoprotein
MSLHLLNIGTVESSRRSVLGWGAAWAAAGALTGCGFKLRGAQVYAFERIVIGPDPGSALAQELRRSFGPAVQVVRGDEPGKPAQLQLNLINVQREKVVVGMNSSGQVREFQLRVRVTLQLQTPQGKDLIENAEISQQRDISFNETAALSKESEEALLYRDMQTDIVQQVLRRLAKVQATQLD